MLFRSMSGTSLFNYYRKVSSEEDEIKFKKVNPEDIKICGKTIDEVITILNGLELEKQTQIKMTMGNLGLYIELFNKEQQDIQRKTLERIFNKED